MTTVVKAIGAQSPTTALAPLSIERRSPRGEDVVIEIAYCGVCHSDLHTARNEWKVTQYPCVPGHEIIGRVSAVGANVTRFTLDEWVGVGCMVDSCGQCGSCHDGLEQYCEAGFTGTYNGPVFGGPNTFGGYSGQIVVKESFVLKLKHKPEQMAAVAPLLCAGITTYSPLKHWQVGPGSRVGVVGLGGLGHMAVKLARAMGAHVTLLTRSHSKIEDGIALGAHQVLLSTDEVEMVAHAGSLDLVLDTVSAPHLLDAYLNLLARDGTLVLVGAPETPHPSPEVFNLIFKRRAIAGSLIGGIAETQEMLDFCAEHGIVSEVELIQPNLINEAYERMLKSDVRYRFVLDIKQL
jgi:uncharacterized zinc-type alcohol dehydrogenase-like protein